MYALVLSSLNSQMGRSYIHRMMHMLVTSVHAKFGESATKIERNKCPKYKVLNEGNLAHVQCELIKFLIAFIT